MSDTILGVLITGMVSIITLIVTKIFDYKKYRSEKNSLVLKEFRAEKIKAYSILSENVQNIDIDDIESIKTYNNKFYFKSCYAYTSDNVNKYFLEFDNNIEKFRNKIINKTLTQEEAKILGTSLGRLTVEIKADIQKEKENIING